MSSQLISRSHDLLRLVDEGYAVTVRDGHLLIGDVPYITVDGEVKTGVLVSPLTLVGDRTARPSDHVVSFAGEAPHDENGKLLSKMINETGRRQMAPGIEVDFSFSSKPPDGYPDFYEKMTAYAHMLAGPAAAVSPGATAQTFRVIDADETEACFAYMDTASSRAGITMATEKFKGLRIAIVGLGGTGSYILDQVAKTPVSEIHLFDDDLLQQHNAFRMPGAISLKELQKAPLKVNYLARTYSKIHLGVAPHPERVTEANVSALASMDFVFVSVDSGASRKIICEALEGEGIPFVDVGIGVREIDGVLTAIIRVAVSTPERPLLRGKNDWLPMASADQKNDYAQNIQVADLNSLNANLAVIAWKKVLGFYADSTGDRVAIYDLEGNDLLNETGGTWLEEAA